MPQFIACPAIENEGSRAKSEKQPFWVMSPKDECVLVAWGNEEPVGESLEAALSGRLFVRAAPDVARRMAYLLNAAADAVDGKVIHQCSSGYVRADE